MEPQQPGEAPSDVAAFAACGQIFLRAYQIEVARAVAASVLGGRGRSFAVMFPRQSGKNELQAQLEAYLLFLLRGVTAEIVKVSPTWKPQSLNAMRRLERVLRANPWTRGAWVKESGYIYRLGSARVTFLSGAPESNIVGATATHLLEVDEAQDVRAAKYDKEVAPMAASTNATRVFWGTAWTSQTLLARELRAARAAEAAADNADGERPPPLRQPRLAFVIPAARVAAEVPAYGDFVAGQVARLGRSHPSVRTQFFSEEIDGQAGMFPPERVERMFARGGAPDGPTDPPPVYAVLVDVAGADESGEGAAAGDSAGGDPGGRRDATALTVVAVDRSTAADPALRAPTYRPVERRLWVGVPHAELYGQIRAAAARWNARRVVIDATGVGAGLASFLERALPGRVTPFTFTAASKSRLGWDFLALVDSGRWQEPHLGADGEQARLQKLFLRQLAFCRSQALPGPARALRWGVPDGTRDPATGEHVHDDLLISAALAAVLDDPAAAESLRAGPGGALAVVRARDPLEDMRSF